MREVKADEPTLRVTAGDGDMQPVPAGRDPACIDDVLSRHSNVVSLVIITTAEFRDQAIQQSYIPPSIRRTTSCESTAPESV